ncbi:hypothetical protein [Ruania zhangjianzhongii]|uniref:hypothetical protein n=1 Tax=Ruania zhangjianzhongii TaxID=2603206 RepID=UPI0011CC42D0|nr:hypothetical protein [Ruania zhangjianzhongii]
MSPDDEGLAPRPPSPLSSAGGQVRRWQILGVSILGGLAVVAFLLSLLLSGSLPRTRCALSRLSPQGAAP